MHVHGVQWTQSESRLSFLAAGQRPALAPCHSKRRLVPPNYHSTGSGIEPMNRITTGAARPDARDSAHQWGCMLSNTKETTREEDTNWLTEKNVSRNAHTHTRTHQ